MLEVQDLTIRAGSTVLVDRVSFTLAQGERLGIIGESGSGKSLTALALAGLLAENLSASGSVRYDGVELLNQSDQDLARLRGSELAYIFQEPKTALNPIRRVWKQMIESYHIHYETDRKQLKERALLLAEQVLLPDPEDILQRFPHELSGGQRQRVAIAAALSGYPKILIADEPTTALDVTIQAEILELFQQIAKETGMALIFITHDLGVLAKIADRALVFSEGTIVEQAAVSALLQSPQHEVTQGLVAAAQASYFSNDAGEAK